MHLNWMNRFGKAIACPALLFAATVGYAIPKGPCEKVPEVCCDEPKPGPFAFLYPYDLSLACPYDFYVHVDGLLFQAKEEGLDFGIVDSNGSGAPISNGEVIGFSDNDSDWGFNPGMRFGVGFYLPHDAWGLDFTWTWLNITEYESTHPSNTGGALIPSWLVPYTTIPGSAINQSVSSSWKVKYNTLDMSLGKPFHVSRHVVFNPHFGLRGAWIDQHYAAHYGSVVPNATDVIMHSDNDFWGFGLRAGVCTDWAIGKGWNLFGNIATAMLFGKFEVQQHLAYPNPATSGSEGFDLDNDFYQNEPNMEIVVGLGWSKYFDKNKYHVSLRAAYEFHEWWNQNNLIRFFGGAGYYAHDTVSRGDLSLNGFSLRLQMDI